jgi:hypothetical protein
MTDWTLLKAGLGGRLPPRDVPPQELAMRVAALILTHPSRHDQRHYFGEVAEQDPRELEIGLSVRARLPLAELAACAWADLPAGGPGLCRTTACAAGWTIILGAPAGATLDMDEDFGVNLPGYTVPGTPLMAPVYAAYLLDLHMERAGWLFAAERTPGEVLAAYVWLAGHPGATRRDLQHAPPLTDVQAAGLRKLAPQAAE